MLPEAYVCHSTVNRVRIRIPGEKGNGSFFKRVEQALLELPGVESVEGNPLTGSVLMRHCSDRDSVFEAVRQQGLLALRETGPARRTTVRQDIARGLKAVDQQVVDLTGGKADLLDIAGLGLLASGIHQIFKGNFAAPAWYTAFWYAFGILSKGPSADRGDGGE